MTLAREKRYAEARKALEAYRNPRLLHSASHFTGSRRRLLRDWATAGAAVEMHSALALAPGIRVCCGSSGGELQSGRFDEALAHARAGGNTAVAQALIGDIREKRGEYVEAAKRIRRRSRWTPGEDNTA